MRTAVKLACASLLSCALVASSGFESPRQPPGSSSTVRTLWRDPGDIASRDLRWAAGSPDRAPKPPFTFVSENLSGSKPKINVKDAAGVSWSVKFAGKPEQNEVHAELAACRLVWALGYFADENYFVPAGTIEGVKDLRRAAEDVSPDGKFTIARFERQSAEGEPQGAWNLEDNRFNGTRELAGLQILMQLLGNWDTRMVNLAVLRDVRPNGDVEERYFVSDLGTTFGGMRGGLGEHPSRWNIDDYREHKFMNGVVMNRLEFKNPLKGRAPFSVPAEHARWFSALASQLTMPQIRSAFEAAGASPAEVDAFSTAFKARIDIVRAALARN